MACLNSDGSLTVVAGAILEALETASEPADVAHATGFPLYRVRSGLREMAEAGLVERLDTGFAPTKRGRELAAGVRRASAEHR